MTLSFRYRFEAAHRFVFSESANCQTPHGHSWHITIRVASTDTKLDGNQMVVEFQKLKKNWKAFVQEHLDHSFFYNTADPIVPALKKNITNFRGFEIPSDPTTELLAILFLRKAEKLIDHPGVKIQEINLEETLVNSIQLATNDKIYRTCEHLKNEAAWWKQPELSARSL